MTWDASMPAMAVAGFAVPEKEVRNVSQPRSTDPHASSKGESFHVPKGQTTGSFTISPCSRSRP
jgi:hypothetical protein